MGETLPKFTEAMKQQPIAFDVYPYIAGSTILRTDMLERADKVLITWSDKVPGMSGRDLARHRPGDGLLDEGGRDRLQPAGAIYFMMDEKDVQAAHEPSPRDDRLGRHPVRRASSSAPVGHLPERARPLLRATSSCSRWRMRCGA